MTLITRSYEYVSNKMSQDLASIAFDLKDPALAFSFFCCFFSKKTELFFHCKSDSLRLSCIDIFHWDIGWSNSEPLPSTVKKRGVGEWADGNMTWTLHGASPVVSPKVESFKISTALRPRLSRSVQERGQHQFFNWTVTPVTQVLFETSVMVVGYNFPIWSKMMSVDFPWNANENFENSVLCISSLPWTPQTLLKKLKQLPATNYNLTPTRFKQKYHKNSPTMKSTFVSTKKCFPWEKNRTCDSWGWWARWTLPPMGSTVMGTKIIKIVGKRLVNGSSFELAIYHGF